VIHRDIKLNNIRVDREGVVKIFDFGLARSQDVAKTQGVVGTPRFIAPELWSSNTVIFDNAVDIYAFGVLALALLNKVLPTELVDLPPKQISRPAIAVSLMGAPKSMVDLLHRCLDHAPSNRPRMEEVQSVLREQLLKNQHRALVAFSNTVHQLDRNNKVINLNATTIGSIGISYTGTEFVISSVTGSVFLNNANATTGQIVPGCCVITFGTQGRSRQFVTFDVSTPEVMP
jgi:serine/threonine protein kinase